jgi:DNA-binding transcriptional LysR family regulator
MMKKKVAFGSSGIPFAFLVPELLPQLISQLEDIELCVDVGFSRTICDKVARGKLEVGITATKQLPEGLDYDIITILDRYVVICPPHHPITQKSSLALTDLKGQDFVGFTEGTQTKEVYDLLFREAGMSLDDLNMVIEVGDTRGVIRLVEIGTGFSIVSELAVRTAVRSGRVAELALPLAEVRRTYYLITSRNHPLSPEAKRVFITTRDILKSMSI